ncbi:MAG: hypothetical protein WC817_00870 [Patescibacteria group bacterium]|jgi:hypothetical protein
MNDIEPGSAVRLLRSGYGSACFRDVGEVRSQEPGRLFDTEVTFRFGWFGCFLEVTMWVLGDDLEVIN